MYIYIRYTVACQYREKRRIKKRTRESRRGHERRTSKRDNDRGDRYGRKSSRSSGETLIEDRVPSRNLRACIRSAENPMLNLTSRTFQVAVKRIRYAQSWPVEYIGKSLKFFYRWKMLELKKRNVVDHNTWFDMLDSILDSWRGEWFRKFGQNSSSLFVYFLPRFREKGSEKNCFYRGNCYIGWKVVDSLEAIIERQ